MLTKSMAFFVIALFALVVYPCLSTCLLALGIIACLVGAMPWGEMLREWWSATKRAIRKIVPQ